DPRQVEELLGHLLQLRPGEAETGVQVSDRGADVGEVRWHVRGDGPEVVLERLERIPRRSGADTDGVVGLVELLADLVERTSDCGRPTDEADERLAHVASGPVEAGGVAEDLDLDFTSHGSPPFASRWHG